MRRVLAAVSALCIILGWIACAVYGPTLLTPPVEAGVDARMDDASGDAGPLCSSATWPARPTTNDPGPLDGGEIVLALRTVLFDVDGGNGALPGFDLDRACTCPGKPSCKPGANPVVCDDTMGRDNSAGLLLASFSAFASSVFDPNQLNKSITSGTLTLLLVIKDWSGAANDTQVSAALFLSNGMEGVQDGGAAQMPKFDGTDKWTVDPKSLFGGTGPPYVPLPDAVDTSAYVVGGSLVSSIPRASLQLLVGVPVDVNTATLTGHLVPTGPGFRIDDGVIAGRLPSRKLLTNLQALGEPLGPGYLCGDSGTYQIVKKAVCAARDIVTAPQNDNTGAPCDALSMAFRFAMSPARMGAVYASGQLPACGPQWTDDCAP